MTENDSSWAQEDDSWQKPTRRIEMASCQADFFVQS